MTYPQQPDEAPSEDTQSLRAANEEQPVSPFGPAPDPHQQGRTLPPQVPVDPFAPQPQYAQPQYPQYPAQPQSAEPSTPPFGIQAYPPQSAYPQTPDAHNPYAPPPVSAPPAYPQPPVSGPPAYVPPQPPVSAPPAYPQPPVSSPPAYVPPQPPVSGPPAYTPPPVSSPPAYTPPTPPVSGPPAYTPPTPPTYTPQAQPTPQPPVSAPPSPYAPPVSGVPVSANPVSGGSYAPQPPLYVPQNQPVDPRAFAPKPADTSGPTYTNVPPPQQPQQWEPPKERRGMPRWLLVSGVLVLVLALAGGAYLFVRAGKGTPEAEPTATQSTPPPGPQLTAVTSPGTRLEYLTSGAPWAMLAAAPPGLNEITSPVGESKTGAPVPAVFVVGGLDTALVPYAGTGKINETASALAESLDGRRYVGADNKPLPGLKREAAPTLEPLRLDGRVALIMRYHMVWDGGGDQVTIVVADMDGARAAVMYAAVPDGEQALQATVAERVLTLHFNL